MKPVSNIIWWFGYGNLLCKIDTKKIYSLNIKKIWLIIWTKVIAIKGRLGHMKRMLFWL